MSIAHDMDRFLTCSRELFNTYFRQPDPWSDPHRAWHLRDRFEPVRSALFRGLVTEPHGLQPLDYGQLHPQISVVARHTGELPVLLNRESGATAGYWDDPVNRLTAEAQLRFVSFFDWAEIERADYRFVMVKVVAWPGVDLAGRFGLVETHAVTFERAD